MILKAINYGNKDGKYYIILECHNKSFSISINRAVVLKHQFSFSLNEIKNDLNIYDDIEIDEILPIFGFASIDSPAYFYISIKIRKIESPFTISYFDIIDSKIVPSIEFDTKPYEEINNVRIS